MVIWLYLQFAIIEQPKNDNDNNVVHFGQLSHMQSAEWLASLAMPKFMNLFMPCIRWYSRETAATNANYAAYTSKTSHRRRM